MIIIIFWILSDILIWKLYHAIVCCLNLGFTDRRSFIIKLTTIDCIKCPRIDHSVTRTSQLFLKMAPFPLNSFLLNLNQLEITLKPIFLCPHVNFLFIVLAAIEIMSQHFFVKYTDSLSMISSHYFNLLFNFVLPWGFFFLDSLLFLFLL